MKIIDFFHFSILNKNEEDLFKLSYVKFIRFLEALNFKKASHYVIPIFDNSILKQKKFINFFKSNLNSNKFSFLFMPNLKSKTLEIDLLNIKKLGFKGIVFHPYLQKNDSINKNILQIIKFCKKNNIFICVCCAYGSKDIYTIYPLKLVSEIAKIFDGKIIIIHSGGLKIFESMLLAEAHKNIYLETSFSLLYWKNSSIEKDFGYVYQKIGAKKIIFGSDNPFMDMNESIKFKKYFFKKNQFSKNDLSKIFYKNAQNFIKNDK
tara:strand:+ start:519 stop:1307 length:789 start_codon:yes stop_codon:yes gene_type:complete